MSTWRRCSREKKYGALVKACDSKLVKEPTNLRVLKIRASSQLRRGGFRKWTSFMWTSSPGCVCAYVCVVGKSSLVLPLYFVLFLWCSLFLFCIFCLGDTYGSVGSLGE